MVTIFKRPTRRCRVGSQCSNVVRRLNFKKPTARAEARLKALRGSQQALGKHLIGNNAIGNNAIDNKAIDNKAIDKKAIERKNTD